MYKFFVLLFFISNFNLYSQELNCQVIINSNLVDQTNQKIFKTLEVSLNEFVNSEVVKSLSGVLLVANMSNNNWDFTENAIKLSRENTRNVIGFITQKRILSDNECFFFNMTPGIRLCIDKEGDQKYRNTADTDIIIVGRGIYNSSDPIESCIQYKKLIF